MTMTAKYAGRCRKCGSPFPAGALIEWDKTSRAAAHALLNECVAQPAPPPAPPIDSASIVAFLRAARDRGLKHPKARFLGPDQRELRLSIAGAGSSYPGAVQVVLDDEWLGRIAPDGAVAGPKLLARPDVLATLETIAGNPAEAASAYGALMGRCSFCSLPLTDAGSVEVGYGAICAKKYGLPHRAKGTPALSAIEATR